MSEREREHKVQSTNTNAQQKNRYSLNREMYNIIWGYEKRWNTGLGEALYYKDRTGQDMILHWAEFT